MSRMEFKSITIYEALTKIRDGDFVMPAFQREYEWNLSRIEKLWDSILQGYPFSTFLFWNLNPKYVTKATFFRDFIKSALFKNNGDNDGNEYETMTIDFDSEDYPTTAVLDGQQRLTSLYLSLFGDFYMRPKYKRSVDSYVPMKIFIELDKNRISEQDAFNSNEYSIFVTDKVSTVNNTCFELRKILDPEFMSLDTRDIKIEVAVETLPENSKEYAKGILKSLCEAVFDKKLIQYTEIFELTQDDALEMFVRFNSGGKPLTKSEIAMSVLTAYWPDAKSKFNQALVGGYSDYGTDFILRTCHMIYGDVVKSNIDQNLVYQMKTNWNKLVKALDNTKELFEMMKIKIERFSSRWNVLIPIIYLIYHNEKYIDSLEGIYAYLFRSIFFGYYSSGTTSRLGVMKKKINSDNMVLKVTNVDSITELRSSRERVANLLEYKKGSKQAGDILYCLNISWIGQEEQYDQDHIHPHNRFDQGVPRNVTPEQWSQWIGLRDKIPNLEFLQYQENESKGNMEFYLYLQNQAPDFKKKHLIPSPTGGMSEMEYYSISNFKNFYEDRKALLIDKIMKFINGDTSEA